ncbi:unnamed protein product [Peronospora farinosa]|uniref:Uncharacterized protein n=1 Tax=Peronospora farinosa TaxID=134698 RepID=A0AAV0UG09_9STRA|nr:unnamed protein product [Peronospora farinosa]CAI5735537.1 unnamed protein product [Peronospora farinosa]
MSKDLLPIHCSDNQPMPHTLRRLSHGLVMDLQQAVQLEKQELIKMEFSAKADRAQPTIASSEEDSQSSTPPNRTDRQQRLATTGKYGGCLPCSPPVPIPQHHEAHRRYSTAGNSEESLTYGLDAEQLQSISTSQCKARLGDEFWNSKLSLDYREPFEVSTCLANDMSRNNKQQVDTAKKMALFKYGSESSITTTAKSVNETDDDLINMVSPEKEEHMLHYGDIFVMEDV